jgi:hypothetical protein
MSQPIATSPTHAPAFRDQVEDQAHDDHDRNDPPVRPSKLWALIESLAYAGVFIDPTGALMAQRLRNARAEEARRRYQP